MRADFSISAKLGSELTGFDVGFGFLAAIPQFDVKPVHKPSNKSFLPKVTKCCLFAVMHLREYLAVNGGATEMAKKLGVTPEAVRLWANGSRTPKPKYMARIAEATNGAVRANDFYEAA